MPNDYTFSLTIPGKKIPELKAGFLKACPIPLDEDGNPKYTVAQWFDRWLKKHLFRFYKTGKIILAREAGVEGGRIAKEIWQRTIDN